MYIFDLMWLQMYYVLLYACYLGDNIIYICGNKLSWQMCLCSGKFVYTNYAFCNTWIYTIFINVVLSEKNIKTII